MSETERLTRQIQAVAGDGVLDEVLRGVLALVRDEATTMEIHRPRDTINVTLTRITRHRLPKAA